MDSDRTEKPTAKRLRDARRKGQVPRSRDLTQAGTLLACLLALGWLGEAIVEGCGVAVRTGLSGLHRFPAHELRLEEMTPLAFASLRTLTVLVGPLAAVAMVASVAFFSVQGGWVFSTQALQPQFNKLNPANGIKRLGLSTGGVEALKMVLLVSALSYLAYRVVSDSLDHSARFARLAPYESARAGWESAARLLKQSALTMFAIAVGDYAMQRWRNTRSLRMSKQEVKDDLKNTEGNPEIKGRIRQIQFSRARRRMLAAVPKATVVVTNPTHFAVALEYQRSVLAAPRVLAKGQGHLAQKIKAIAREHGVPMVENVPLAQALYKSTEVGDFIPAELFEAVAEVLAYLIRLKQLVL